MSNYVDLDRRFRNLTDEEREDPSILAMMGDSEPFHGDPWDKVLESGRVVVFATAGSGKTKEMQAQTARLRTVGKNAFFIPIEALDKEDLKGFLAQEAGELERWEKWLQTEGEQVWIFLDSVDELKLINGKLDKALTKVATAIGPARDRAHIVLSCRPTDWRPVQDMETFRAKLPPRAAKKVVVTAEEALLAPFKTESDSQPHEAAAKIPETRLVVLLPLARQQIEVFASAKGVADPKALLAEIHRSEAWPFARRPLDLQNLILAWTATGSLGSLLQQHEADIANSLKDDDERPDASVLSPDEARDGAERLALAMLMTKSRTIRSLEQQSGPVADNSALDASSILSNWDDAKVKALLRRSIFDPATYGRIRFHHRSIQEFLAASYLRRLTEKNLPKAAVHRLFFAVTYGEQVIVPSMRPVAAWLAQTDLEVRREILAREPEVLLLHGDPGSLQIDARAALVRTYVTAYSSGSWRGLDMPVTEIRRLAKPDLAAEIRNSWSTPRSNEEVITFLLKLIWLGVIQECADIAFDALVNPKLGAHARIIAARALADCGRSDLLRTAADDALAHPEQWTAQIYYSLVESLYPSVISAAELEQLVLRVPEPKDDVSGFAWTLYCVAEELEPGSEAAVSLRNLLEKLIWDGRVIPGEYYHPKSGFSRYSGALARLCTRELERPTRADAALIRACAIANRLDDDNIVGREELDRIKSYFRQAPGLRAQTFWIELEIMDALAPAAKPDDRAWHVMHESLLGQHTVSDWPWLLDALQQTHPARDVALASLGRLWRFGEQRQSDLDVLKAAVADDSELTALLIDITTIRPPNPAIVQMEKDHEERQRARAAKQEATKQSWTDWKAAIDADPTAAFANGQKLRTLSTLVQWLRQADRHHRSKLFYANWRDVRWVFGDVVADGFEVAIKQYWREHEPPVWSTRKVEERNSIWHSQGVALTGLAIEAAGDESWARELDDDDARRAAEWGLVEISGIPEWYGGLAVARPKEVTAAIEVELSAELAEADKVSHPHTLSALRHGAAEIRPLAAPMLIRAVTKWPAEPADADARALQTDSLTAALAIIVASDLADSSLCDLFEQRIFAAPDASSATVWLQGLCAIDLARGVVAFRRGLEALPDGDRSTQAIRWLGIIFGDRGFDHYGAALTLDVDAELLLELTLTAYEFVRREDDVQHEGVFSPDVRDEAESARNRLMSALVGRPGPATHQALLTLSGEPLFAHMPDRLVLMARQRGALDSEAAALSPADYKLWEQRAEYPPRNRDELFQCMMNELEDIQHDLLHHDYTDRDVLAPIDKESGMQPLIAKKLSDAARDRYQVVREDEVADDKEPDIRLLGRSCPDRAVIEVKIGDRWSVSELEAALDRQVIGQYLRHRNCSAGCLLVTYAGRKGFEEPGTGVAMTFEQVMARLKIKAALTESAEQGRIRLSVMGLDLRSPLPESLYKATKSKKAGAPKGPRRHASTSA